MIHLIVKKKTLLICDWVCFSLKSEMTQVINLTIIINFMVFLQLCDLLGASDCDECQYGMQSLQAEGLQGGLQNEQ